MKMFKSVKYIQENINIKCNSNIQDNKNIYDDIQNCSNIHIINI